MALTFGVGKGKDRNSKHAARLAAEACQFQLCEQQPHLLVLFLNPFYHSHDVLETVREFYKNVPLIGCSSAGEIYTTGIEDKTIGLLGIAGIKVNLAAGGDIAEDAFLAGKMLGSKLGGEAGALILLLTDGVAGDGEAVVRGMQAGLGNQMPMIGGAAGDDAQFKQTYQYINDAVLTGTLVGVKLDSSVRYGIGVHHGWEPVGLPVTATRTHGNHLMEINNISAIKLYDEYFSAYTKRLRDEPLARLAVYYPLGIPAPEVDGYLLRAPLFVEADGAIKFTAEIPENSEVRLMIGSVEEALSAARKAAQDALDQMGDTKPQVALVFSGVARRRVLGLKANAEIQVIREIIGKSVPVIGFFGYGEIAPLGRAGKTNTRFHNETVVILTLG